MKCTMCGEEIEIQDKEGEITSWVVHQECGEWEPDEMVLEYLRQKWYEVEDEL